MSFFGQDTNSEMMPEYGEQAKKRMALSEKLNISEVDKKILKDSADEISKNFAGTLKVGDQAPDFELTNAEGKIVKLSEFTQKTNVVLCFYRGNWCPYCNIEISALVQSIPLLKKLNAKLILISPQISEKTKEIKEKYQGQYEMLSDLDYKVCKNYKVYYELPDALQKVYKESFKLDIESFNGKGRTALPMAATFIINKENKITSVFCDPDYRKRMEPSEILIELSKLPRPEK